MIPFTSCTKSLGRSVILSMFNGTSRRCLASISSTQQHIPKDYPIVKTIELQTAKPIIHRSQIATPVNIPISRITPEPYTVTRTPTKFLPVYELRKGNGTLKLTRVRKIGGDKESLRRQLEDKLKPTPEYVKINGLTGHIVIKGWYKTQIDLFLKEKGF